MAFGRFLEVSNVKNMDKDFKLVKKINTSQDHVDVLLLHKVCVFVRVNKKTNYIITILNSFHY